MSRVKVSKTSLSEEPTEEQEKPHLALVETAEDGTPAHTDAAPPAEDEDEALEAEPADLVVYIDSLGVSLLDRYSLVRVFREEWRSKVAFYRSEKGGSLTLEQAVERATHKVDEQRAAEIFERVMTQSSEVTDFDDLHKLWTHSPEDATVTADNGTEFHDYRRVERLTGAAFYFARPYHSWERGSNENANGLIRQYLPKGQSMAGLSQRQCNAIARKLNTRPRKRLGFRTPLECFNES